MAGSGGGCGGLRGLEIDLVAQVLEAPDEAALETFAATLVEVLDAEVVVDLAAVVARGR